MPLLPEEWVQELLSRLDIREVIERYVPLQEKGSRYWACCPFHHEKTPSFSVSPDKGLYYCYGCHKGGNTIHFVSEIEKINFREACEKLADGCGLELPSDSFSKERQHQREKLDAIRKVNKAAAHLFVDQLYTPQGTEALAYLRRRGLTDRDIRRNGLGYAPADWHAAHNALGRQGFSDRLLADAGLCRTGKTGPYDLFRNRVMFPIIDTSRNVIGFGGRVMDDQQPKYLNSPETLLFNKGKNLYHLNVVQGIGRLPYILLMEGYMDVICADRFGIPNAVATLGTAITPDQARLLKRWRVPVYISYDGDGAGIKAALKAVGVLEAAGVTCKVIVLPGGMDPDEYLIANGREGFETAIETALEPVPFRFRQMAAGLDLTDPGQKEMYVDKCVGVIRALQSAVAQERYAKMLADETGFSARAILRDAGMASAGAARTGSAHSVRRGSPPTDGTIEQRAEDFLAAYVMHNPQRASQLLKKLSASDFTNPADAAVLAAAAACEAKGILPRPNDIVAALGSEEYRSHAAQLLMNDEDAPFSALGDLDAFADSCADRLVLRRMEKELAEILQLAGQCEDAAEQTALKRKYLDMNARLHEMRDALRRAN